MPKKLDRLAELRTQLGPTLAAGESVTVAHPVRRSLGTDEAAEADADTRARATVERLAGPPQPDRKRGVFERAADFVVSAVTDTSPIDLPTPELSDPNGVALAGGPNSQAVWLRDIIGEHPCVLAATARRWFVLRDDAGAPERYRALAAGSPLPYDVLAELPRDQVREVRSAPTTLARGRVEVLFTDGSMLAVAARTRDEAEALAQA